MRALTCLWLPPQHVWRQTVDFASYFHLDLSVLRNPVSTISSKAFGYATICFREGHTHKAKKNLIHSIRYLLYGIQIAERGRIDDFSDGNEYYYALVRPVSEASDTSDANSCDDSTRHSRTAPAPPADGGDVEGEDEEALRDEYRRIAKDTHARFDRLLPPKAKRPRKPRRRKEKDGGADARGGEDHDGDA